MQLQTYYRLVKRNAKGEVIEDTGKLLSHSYVLQFLQFLEGRGSFREITAKDVTGAQTTLIKDGTEIVEEFGHIHAGAGVDTFGIVVGTNAGTTAEDNENYKLDTQIAHSGTGEAGKLNHQAMVINMPAVVGVNVDMDISRAFVNETGSPITVKEIGVYCENEVDNVYHMFMRDVVTDKVVADAETLTVTYTLRTTV